MNLDLLLKELVKKVIRIEKSVGELERREYAKGVREKLTTNRTYYVRTDGNDNNNGLSNTAEGAFKTIQKAVNTIAENLDIAGYTVTIQVGDGTYNENVVLKNVTGFATVGNLVINGNSSNPTNVIVSCATGVGFRSDGLYSVWDIKNLKIAEPYGIYAVNGSMVRFSGVDFGACSSYHMIAGAGSKIICTGNYSISGNSAYHMYTPSGYIECINMTVSITANITITIFASATRHGYIRNQDTTFSLGSYTVTGTRYYGTQISLIFTNGGGANYFPGNSAGSVDATSLYA